MEFEVKSLPLSTISPYPSSYVIFVDALKEDALNSDTWNERRIKRHVVIQNDSWWDHAHIFGSKHFKYF